ncbi:MAG: acyltransferase [Pseudomonadales bacterium]|nr:acyltransferase [Pseudomonadales bacterium]
MKYRAEIDGLRAIAVVPVILFHAGVEYFSGGFVGVDIFFVISGYLITSILIEEVSQNKFSIAKFYERRIRRILPALTLVALASIVGAWFFMLPSQMESFAKSLIAVSLFASNIQFWTESGYFDTVTEEKPLLHTWSLAVEEQYYIFFPILLLFSWRLGRDRAFWIVSLCAFASLAISEWGWRNAHSANFYLIPSRVWELFAGSMAAFYVHKHGVHKNNFLALLGLAAIILSIFMFDESTPFPSIYALLPICGVVLLIIYANQTTLAARILSTKAFVGIGLISYSAYLWHQPLFAFTRIASYEKPSITLMAFMSLASLLLAYFSWKYVENPFRRTTAKRSVVFLCGGASLCFLAVAGIVILNSSPNTYFQLANPDFKEDISLATTWENTDCVDFIAKEGDVHCRKSKQTGDYRVVMWGDSHLDVLTSTTPNIEGIEIIQIIHSGCPPLVEVARFDQTGNAKNCTQRGTLTSYASYIRSLNPDLIILAGRWSLYLNGHYSEGELQKAHHFLMREGYTKEEILENQNTRFKVLLSALHGTFDFFSMHQVAVLDQPIDFGYTEKRKLVKYPSIPEDLSKHWNHMKDSLLSKLIDVDILSSKNLFCEEGVCETQRNNVMLYRDNNHVTNFGSKIIWDELLTPYITSQATRK